jgi:Terminase DNA packaging enzyme
MNTETQIMTANEALVEALGLDTLVPVPPRPPAALIPRPIEADDRVPGDADYVRSNMIEIIERGSESVDQAMELARESQHPRAFEVLAQLLKVQADNVDKLLKIHADVKKLNAPDEYAEGSVTTNTTNIANAIFVGTSNDLVRMMRREHTTPLTIEVDDE